MNSEFQSRIAHERAKLTLLLAKVEECKIKIAALEMLSNNQHDAFDDALENAMLSSENLTAKSQNSISVNEALAVAAKKVADVPVASDEFDEPSPGTRRSPLDLTAPKPVYVRKDSVAPEILTFLGSSRKNIDDVDVFVEAIFGKKSRGAVRNLLWNLKKQGLVSSPQTGSYVVTEAGREFLAQRRREV